MYNMYRYEYFENCLCIYVFNSYRYANIEIVVPT